MTLMYSPLSGTTAVVPDDEVEKYAAAGWMPADEAPPKTEQQEMEAKEKAKDEKSKPSTKAKKPPEETPAQPAKPAPDDQKE